MFIKMLRTQTTAVGTLFMDNAYDMTAPNCVGIANKLVERKLAKKLNKKAAGEANAEAVKSAYKADDDAADGDAGQ